MFEYSFLSDHSLRFVLGFGSGFYSEDEKLPLSHICFDFLALNLENVVVILQGVQFGTKFPRVKFPRVTWPLVAGIGHRPSKGFSFVENSIKN